MNMTAFGTQQMIQAERELDGRIDFAFSKAAELREKMAEVDEKLAKDNAPPTAREVEQFRAYIQGHAQTAEWQVVLERIARGELTWRKIVEDLAENQVDRDVSAAMASLSKVAKPSFEELVASGVLPDPAAVTAEDKPKPEESARESRRARPAYGDNDDDWNEDQSIFVRR
ncbi:hypothetical protein BLA60_05820 [Actinophytocola xinjiangensis]|uniref:Uncharacterized protein n=1 Tax=Actinophytocola xinjiangensis TaxID=485602 RepID=A0A7Z1B006_9PSEU|nr:hypothetical protein [Actinophytocola xinjiangensis]OLF12786.1 hypothetical protein BLA60_05820 [Actinophytocola xinjiangensis]